MWSVKVGIALLAQPRTTSSGRHKDAVTENECITVAEGAQAVLQRWKRNAISTCEWHIIRSPEETANMTLNTFYTSALRNVPEHETF